MQNLTKNTAYHDNPNSKTHSKDREAKKLRDQNDWVPIAALSKESGAKIAEGVSQAPRNGFCFWMQNGSASRAKNDAEYTRAALKRSEELRKLKYTRVRNGKERSDYLRRKHGMDSVVFTVAPWAQKTVQRIGATRRQELALFLAEKIDNEIRKVSGRQMFGGGVHEDTAVLHWHCHVEKTTPKATFKIAGPWTCGSYRISQKFPDLLTPAKQEMLQSNLEKKDFDRLVDIHVSLRIDQELEKWIKEEGLWKKYEQDCKDYLRDKRRKQEREKDAPLIKASLVHYALKGVWPLAYKVMTLMMWRMIPRELRKPIALSIRTYQVIKAPARNIVPLLRELHKINKPQRPLPKMGFH